MDALSGQRRKNIRFRQRIYIKNFFSNFLVIDDAIKNLDDSVLLGQVFITDSDL